MSRHWSGLFLAAGLATTRSDCAVRPSLPVRPLVRLLFPFFRLLFSRCLAIPAALTVVRPFRPLSDHSGCCRLVVTIPDAFLVVTGPVRPASSRVAGLFSRHYPGVLLASVIRPSCRSVFVFGSAVLRCPWSLCGTLLQLSSTPLFVRLSSSLFGASDGVFPVLLVSLVVDVGSASASPSSPSMALRC